MPRARNRRWFHSEPLGARKRCGQGFLSDLCLPIPSLPPALFLISVHSKRVSVWGQKSGVRGPGKRDWREGGTPPHSMEDHQNKGVAKWASQKWLKREEMRNVERGEGEFQNGNLGYTPGSFRKNGEQRG